MQRSVHVVNGPARSREAAGPIWRAILVARWTHIQEAIAESEYDFSRLEAGLERDRVGQAVALLKRAALSVWLDGRQVGVDLGVEVPPPRVAQ